MSAPRGPSRRLATPRRAWLWLAIAAMLLGAPVTGRAQDAPNVRRETTGRHRFAPLLADPREVRLGAGLAWTDLFAPGQATRERPPFAFSNPAAMAVDVHATVALGGTLPVWETRQWPAGGILVGVQAGVFARFRIEEPSRDYAASDWMVGLPIELEGESLAGRLRLVHRSAHLGDEIIQSTGMRRIEFGHEALEFLGSYRPDRRTRLYGGGAWIFRSNTEAEPLLGGRRLRDDAALQAGGEGAWPLGGDRAELVAGVDWQAAARTGWRHQLSAIAGIRLHSPGGPLRIQFRHFRGPSSVGEFFLTDESFWGIEVVAER